jgi:hypothetical protein
MSETSEGIVTVCGDESFRGNGSVRDRELSQRGPDKLLVEWDSSLGARASMGRWARYGNRLGGVTTCVALNE